jgi:hypothetical protein
MKFTRVLAVVLLAAPLSFLASAPARAFSALPPVAIKMYCAIEGRDYPVDTEDIIWGRGGSGDWSPVGIIEQTRFGLIARRFGAKPEPTFCVVN